MFGQLTSTGNSALQDRKWRTFRVLGRLSTGVTIQQASAEVRSQAKAMARENPNTNEEIDAILLPMRNSHYGIQEPLSGPLSILLVASGVVLLLVCSNVASLLLARSIARRTEFSVRLALGASRSRLIRQVLTESLIIVGIGALAGLATARGLSGALGWLLPRNSAPTLSQAPIDAGVLAFTTALAVAVALLAGIVPALFAARGDINEVLKEGGRTGSSGNSNRLQKLLVISEMALAFVALIGAGLLVRSFYRVSGIQPGFDPESIAVARLSLSAANYDAQQADSFCRRLSEQLQRQPSVAAVGYADYVPLSIAAGSWEDLQIQGYVPPPGTDMKIYSSLVSPGYFDLMKIPLLEGRDFNLGDDVTAQPVMIVNEEFVRRFIPDRIAIGRSVRGWGKWFTIVGVVHDSKIYRLTEPPTPYFYAPARQVYRAEMGFAFYVRTSGPIDNANAALRSEIRAADPSVLIFDVSPLNDIIIASLFVQRVSATMLSVLGIVALLLASIGLYGVMSYSVAQRTNEIGIRVALGARKADILKMVISQGMRLVAAGVVIGLVGALLTSRFMESLLFDVSTKDILSYLSVSLLLAVVALFACFIPAYRAAKADPLTALRYN
jgi:predicted permease